MKFSSYHLRKFFNELFFIFSTLFDKNIVQQLNQVNQIFLQCKPKTQIALSFPLNCVKFLQFIAQKN